MMCLEYITIWDLIWYMSYESFWYMIDRMQCCKYTYLECWSEIWTLWMNRKWQCALVLWIFSSRNCCQSFGCFDITKHLAELRYEFCWIHMNHVYFCVTFWFKKEEKLCWSFTSDHVGWSMVQNVQEICVPKRCFLRRWVDGRRKKWPWSPGAVKWRRNVGGRIFR